jgi:hypothetical protein
VTSPNATSAPFPTDVTILRPRLNPAISRYPEPLKGPHARGRLAKDGEPVFRNDPADQRRRIARRASHCLSPPLAPIVHAGSRTAKEAPPEDYDTKQPHG